MQALPTADLAPAPPTPARGYKTTEAQRARASARYAANRERGIAYARAQTIRRRETFVGSRRPRGRQPSQQPTKTDLELQAIAERRKARERLRVAKALGASLCRLRARLERDWQEATADAARRPLRGCAAWQRNTRRVIHWPAEARGHCHCTAEGPGGRTAAREAPAVQHCIHWASPTSSDRGGKATAGTHQVGEVGSPKPAKSETGARQIFQAAEATSSTASTRRASQAHPRIATRSATSGGHPSEDPSRR